LSESIHHIDFERLPKHIAVIMDGNGRWAKSKGMPRVFGHKNGVTAVREISEACAELGIKHLTLYAFSTENWNRPPTEVSALMTLLVETIRKEIKTLNKNNIRLNAIGDLSKLPEKSYHALKQGMQETSANTGLTLHLALNYSSRWEITHAVKNIATDIQNGKISVDAITEGLFEQYLNTNGIPDPELLIRTSGEMRISNYLLWQIAYTELIFLDVMWPEFRKINLYTAIEEYQKRERRFGKTGDQVGTETIVLS
jgi:undecaprenyl diphosphate synthase